MSSVYFSTGFNSQKDADAVANMFVNMILQGDLIPKLSKKAIDFFGLKNRNKNI